MDISNMDKQLKKPQNGETWLEELTSGSGTLDIQHENFKHSSTNIASYFSNTHIPFTSNKPQIIREDDISLIEIGESFRLNLSKQAENFSQLINDFQEKLAEEKMLNKSLRGEMEKLQQESEKAKIMMKIQAMSAFLTNLILQKLELSRKQLN